GNRSYYIGLIYTKGNGRFVERMIPHQGNIGSMQRCYNWNVYTLRLEHLFGHIGSVGMWNGIMNVKNLNIVEFHHINQLTRKGKLIWLIVKQRVFRNVDLVKMNFAT